MKLEILIVLLTILHTICTGVVPQEKQIEGLEKQKNELFNKINEHYNEITNKDEVKTNVTTVDSTKKEIDDNNTNIDNQTKEMEDLEKEKNSLFTELNAAIEETILSLQKTNDTDAVLGVDYIKELRSQLKELNASSDVFDLANETVRDNNSIYDVADGSDLKLRRNLNRWRIKNLFQDKDIIQLQRIYEKKEKSGKVHERFVNRGLIQKKIDAWLAERERERERLRLYKLNHTMGEEWNRLKKQETCPNYGEKKSKKKKTRRQGGKGRKKMVKYPCCRKCCKSSYMHCL